MKKKKILAAMLSGVIGTSMLPLSAGAEDDITEIDVSVMECDCDLDGTAGVPDAVFMQRFLVGKQKNVTAEQLKKMDQNKDGKVNVFDLNCLLRKLSKALGVHITVEDLTKNIEPYSVELTQIGENFKSAQTDFAVELLKSSLLEDDNTLVSPYSVVTALAMTANGANGVTKEEMSRVLSGGMAQESFNSQLSSYIKNQPNDEDCKLVTADSIWLKNDGRFIPDKAFLQANKSYYDAQIYSAPFNMDTVNDVNSWVNKNTDGMIPRLINEINPETIMMLINAVTFDAKWKSPYTNSYESAKAFTDHNGEMQSAWRMSSTEHKYLCGENATGFVKDYAGGRYSFAAILPNEGVDIIDYAKNLTGEDFRSLMENVQETAVKTYMPRFSSDYSSSLKESLKVMGMDTAFDKFEANFDKMGKCVDGYKPYISDVIHKTHIEVGEKGTRAAAATVVIMDAPTAVMPPPLKVDLNRPFLYAIVDNETNIPIFIGTVLKL